MNSVHKKQSFLYKYSSVGVCCVLSVFIVQSVSFAGLIREQEGLSAFSAAPSQSSSDAGYDFVKLTKSSKTISTKPVRPTPQISRTHSDARVYQRKAVPQYQVPKEEKPVYETQSLGKKEVAAYQSSSEPVFPQRKVIHRPKVESTSTAPKEFMSRTERSAELTLGQQKKKKERYLDALFLRAEAYYEAREYDAAMQTVNSIFMFDPYHVKAQRLRKKIEIKASNSRSGREGPSLFTRIFGNSKHRKQIGLARKLYKEGQYAQAQKVCQRVILEDPYNNKAEKYIKLCKQRLAEPMTPSVMPSEEKPQRADTPAKAPLKVEPPVVKEEPVAPVSEPEAPVAPPMPEYEAPLSLETEDVISEPASKAEAQEVALNAMLASMGQTEEVGSQTEASRVSSPTVLPQEEVQRDPTMKELAVMARNNLDFNDLENAQDILNQMLVKDPESALAQEVMNDISEWIQDSERARSDPSINIDRQKKKIKRMLERAKKAYKAKSYDHARALYQEVLSVDPANRSARKGIEKTNKSEKKDAVKKYVQSINTLHARKRYAEATSVIEQGLALDPSNTTLKKLKRKNKKLSASPEVKPSPKKEETVIKPQEKEQPAPKSTPKKKKSFFSFLSPKKKPLTGHELQVSNLLTEAKKAYKQRHYVESIALYEEVFRLDPGNKKASKGVDRAREKMILKGRDKKTAQQREIENERTEKIEFYTSMAEKLHQQGKYDSAKIVIHKGLLLDPDDTKLNTLRSDNDVYAKQSGGVPADAAKDALTVKKGALINKGIKQYLLGDYDEAVKHFNEVLKLDPDDEKAKNSIQKIQRKQQRLDLSAE